MGRPQRQSERSENSIELDADSAPPSPDVVELDKSEAERHLRELQETWLLPVDYEEDRRRA